jgi:hypothetical protein
VYGLSVIIVIIALGLLAARPSASVAAEPIRATSPTPDPSNREEQGKFRTYVSTITIDGAGLVAAIIQLRSCNGNRDACRHAVDQARMHVIGFETDLDSTSAPACLSEVDAQLRSALGFYDNGLALVAEGGDAEDQLKVVQGGILIGVGSWKLGAATRAAKRSQC